MDQKSKSQKTKQKIINVSIKLFMQKGFDKTSMRDIVEASGMSKGAIYHQFSSKEEIMKAVYKIQDDLIDKQLGELKEEIEGKNGKEEIGLLIKKSIEGDVEQKNSVTEFMKSAEYILKYIRDNVDKNAPILAEMIKKGNQDGSLACEFPEELSEVFLILFNIWCDAGIFKADKEKVERKILFIQFFMKSCGVDVLDNNLIEELKRRL